VRPFADDDDAVAFVDAAAWVEVAFAAALELAGERLFPVKGLPSLVTVN